MPDDAEYPPVYAAALARKRQRYADDPELGRRTNLWRLYKITPEQYDELRHRQAYRCAICGLHEDEITPARTGRPRKDGSPPTAAMKLVVDHCHNTLAIRGLLCAACNRALGHFHDDPQRLQAAADYIVRLRGAVS